MVKVYLLTITITDCFNCIRVALYSRKSLSLVSRSRIADCTMKLSINSQNIELYSAVLNLPYDGCEEL